MAAPTPDVSGLTPDIVAQNFLDIAANDIRKGMTLKESMEDCYVACPLLRDSSHFKQTYPPCFVEVLKRLQAQQDRLVDVTETEGKTLALEAPEETAEQSSSPSPEE